MLAEYLYKGDIYTAVSYNSLGIKGFYGIATQ